MHAIWHDLATAGGVTLTGAMEAALGRFIDLLIEANRVVNLTRIDAPQEAATLHVADALTLLPHLPPIGASLADLGSGGGVPGIPLAIVRPDLRVTLVDATRKKVDAAAGIAAALGLSNVAALHARFEQVEGRYDCITARAVADLATLIEWCAPRLAPGGRLLAMKGPRVHVELAAATALLSRRRLTATLHPAPLPGREGGVVCVVARPALR